jgi:glutamine amidotransferase
MHNGEIAEFPLIKRKLQLYLSDEIFHTVIGNTGLRGIPRHASLQLTPTRTDSEWAFALFLSKVIALHL